MSPLAFSTAWPHPIRASDGDRAGTIALLRDHWMAGRLSLDEFEERCAEVWRARYVAELWAAVRELPVGRPLRAPAGRISGSAVASVVLAAAGLAMVMVSFGLLSLISLPFSATGWMFGRRARRAAPAGRRGAGALGEAMGALGVLLACLALTACAAILA